jgi:multicomponent Na+:H+ antiporter subunit G
MTLLAFVLLTLGALLLVVAAWGTLALPDALARQHAATKAGTLALALVCVGAMAAASDGAWTWRLLLILGFLLATLPLAAHLLARAAVREAGLDHLVRTAPRQDGAQQEPAQPGLARATAQTDAAGPIGGR